MEEYADINDRPSLVKAIKGLQVLGGFSRSYTIDPVTGDEEPGRYIETVGDYVTDLAIEKAVDAMFDNSFCINSVEGAIVGLSLDRITVLTSEGKELHYLIDNT